MKRSASYIGRTHKHTHTQQSKRNIKMYSIYSEVFFQHWKYAHIHARTHAQQTRDEGRRSYYDMDVIKISIFLMRTEICLRVFIFFVYTFRFRSTFFLFPFFFCCVRWLGARASARVMSKGVLRCFYDFSILHSHDNTHHFSSCVFLSCYLRKIFCSI